MKVPSHGPSRSPGPHRQRHKGAGAFPAVSRPDGTIHQGTVCGADGRRTGLGAKAEAEAGRGTGLGAEAGAGRGEGGNGCEFL
jgi:hypothetical protein